MSVEPRSTNWGWRVAAFALVFLLLQRAYAAASGSWVEHLVIDVATVQTAAVLLGALWPGMGVHAAGARIASPGGSINVLNGCEGTDVIFLLVAAMLAAPLPWRQRLFGLAVGVPFVFALNQARLMALFHALRHDPVWFGRLHSTVGPLLLVLAVGLFFAWWLARAPGGAKADRAMQGTEPGTTA
jgi:exosortase family protein XrtM